MKVFASWSGVDSREAAELFRDWLPNVLQEVEVWVSSQDINKGEKWSESLWASLSEHQFGILFVTKTNFESPWILFEAGALSKTVQSFVIPLLCNVDRIDISSSPLNQFQNSRATREDVFQVVEAINRVGARPLPPERLRPTFEKWWPDFEDSYRNINFLDKADAKPAGGKVDGARLDKIEDVLESIMGTLQNIRKEVRKPTITVREDLRSPEKIVETVFTTPSGARVRRRTLNGVIVGEEIFHRAQPDRDVGPDYSRVPDDESAP